MKKPIVIILVVLAFSCKKKDPATYCFVCKSTDTTDAWNGYNPCDMTEAQMNAFMLFKTKKGDTTKCKILE